MKSKYWNHIILVTVLTMLPLTWAHGEPLETETLVVQKANESGFGDRTNQYAWAMEPFKGSLYVATLNIKYSRPYGILKFFYGLPFATNGAQVYRGTLSGHGHWTWNRVLRDGLGNSNNYGIRKMKAVGEFLYALSANHNNGFELWRTSNGTDWHILMENGFGSIANLSGRALIAFNGYLYLGVENRITGAKIWRREIDASGDFVVPSEWQAIELQGFGDAGNCWFSDYAEYHDWLYVGTLNPKGMELWRTRDGTTYEMVFDRGNGLLSNRGIMKLFVYKDRLYAGTMNWIEGAYLYANVDVHGTQFEEVMAAGMGNSKNTYVWYIQEYNDRLYVGTYNRDDLGFYLYSARDPGVDTWITETANAFDNPIHHGIRSMAVFQDRLMIGSATASVPCGCVMFEAIAK